MRKSGLLLCATILLLPGCVLAIGNRSHDDLHHELKQLEKRVRAIEKCCEQLCSEAKTACGENCSKPCCA